MNKFNYYFFLFFVILSFGIWAQSFWGGKTLTSSEVKEKWGQEKLDLKINEDAKAIKLAKRREREKLDRGCSCEATFQQKTQRLIFDKTSLHAKD